MDGYIVCGSRSPSQDEQNMMMDRLAHLPLLRQATLDNSKVLHIPVALIVLHHGSLGKLSYSQIFDQISVLNRAFNGELGDADFATSTNKVPESTTSNMRFFVDSIQYVEDAVWFDQCRDLSDEIRRAIVKDPANKMYVISCNSKYLGWTWSPWLYTEDDYRNAVFVNFQAFPNGSIPYYNLGRTAVHEIGHYFGLLHTFSSKEDCVEENGDGIYDTPVEKYPSTTCTTIKDTCPNHPGIDPSWNFMDYSIDQCLIRFSSGQIQRMQDTISIQKPSLLQQDTSSDFGLSLNDTLYLSPGQSLSYNAVQSSRGNLTLLGTPQDSATSAKTCAQLNLSFMYRNSNVCGMSQIQRTCYKTSTFADAYALCTSVGARLCSDVELGADAARSTGCGLDSRLVWTATPCGLLDFTGRKVRMGSNSTEEPVCVSTHPSQVAGVRCCADASISTDTDVLESPAPNMQSTTSIAVQKSCDNLPGFQFRYGNLEICAASNIRGMCYRDNANAAQAQTVCHRVGARLCTSAELSLDVARGTGCGLDMLNVWTSSPCMTAENHSGLVVQRGKQSFVPRKCVASAATHPLFGVRCCATVAVLLDSSDGVGSSTPVPAVSTKRSSKPCALLPGFSFRFGNHAVCGASKINGQCYKDVATHSGAATLCEQLGARLCTVTELSVDTARGTGCGLDIRYVWTSTPCAEGDTGRMQHTGKRTAMAPQCVDAHTLSDTRSSVRCCADAAAAASSGDGDASTQRNHPDVLKQSAAVMWCLAAVFLVAANVNYWFSCTHAAATSDATSTLSSLYSAEFEPDRVYRTSSSVQSVLLVNGRNDSDGHTSTADAPSLASGESNEDVLSGRRTTRQLREADGRIRTLVESEI